MTLIWPIHQLRISCCSRYLWSLITFFWCVAILRRQLVLWLFWRCVSVLQNLLSAQAALDLGDQQPRFERFAEQRRTWRWKACRAWSVPGRPVRLFPRQGWHRARRRHSRTWRSARARIGISLPTQFFPNCGNEKSDEVKNRSNWFNFPKRPLFRHRDIHSHHSL